MQQLDLFKSIQLRDKGIEQAIDNAEATHDNWGDLAYSFLIGYAMLHTQFMAEDVRVSSIGIVPEPPSKRAWGGVFVRAKKSGLIKSVGFGCVKNPKAHRTPATVWEVV